MVETSREEECGKLETDLGEVLVEKEAVEGAKRPRLARGDHGGLEIFIHAIAEKFAIYIAHQFELHGLIRVGRQERVRTLPRLAFAVDRQGVHLGVRGCRRVEGGGWS